MAFKLQKRHLLVLLGHLGFFVVYALRVNLSVALVAMVNSTYANQGTTQRQKCGGGVINVTTEAKEKTGEFNWDQQKQGMILSSFFYGYLFTQLPGGWLGNKYGGKWVFLFGVLVTSILTLLTPVAAKTSIYLFVALRIVEGLGEGVTFPAMHSMIAKWAPPNERSRMVIFTYSGATTGTIITLPICSLLADSNILGGWPSAFYFTGVLGVIWSALWAKFAFNSPDTHPTISDEEKKYLKESLANSSAGSKEVFGCCYETIETNVDGLVILHVTVVPWVQILTSVRVWSIIIAHFSHNWIWYLVLTDLPSYFNQVLNFNLKQNGVLSSLPFFIGFITYLSSGIIADFLIKNWLSVTATRRLMGICAFYTAALFLVLASYTRCDQIALSVTYMVLATGFLCFNNSGYNVNHLDIGPRFGGVLMGLTNLAGTVSGCLTPLVTGYFTNEHPTRENYRKVFLVAAGVAVVGGTFFNIFVSGELQPWNSFGISSKNNDGIDNMSFKGKRKSSKIEPARNTEEMITSASC